jgi:hypothetical protein
MVFAVVIRFVIMNVACGTNRALDARQFCVLRREIPGRRELPLL